MKSQCHRKTREIQNQPVGVSHLIVSFLRGSFLIPTLYLRIKLSLKAIVTDFIHSYKPATIKNAIQAK